MIVWPSAIEAGGEPTVSRTPADRVEEPLAPATPIMYTPSIALEVAVKVSVEVPVPAGMNAGLKDAATPEGRLNAERFTPAMDVAETVRSTDLLTSNVCTPGDTVIVNPELAVAAHA